jgi:hypothetical protein
MLSVVMLSVNVEFHMLSDVARPYYLFKVLNTQKYFHSYLFDKRDSHYKEILRDDQGTIL